MPFYAALPVSTIDWSIEDGRDIPIEERAAAELTHMRGKTAAGHRGDGAGRARGQRRSLKLAFDVTPARLCHGPDHRARRLRGEPGRARREDLYPERTCGIRAAPRKSGERCRAARDFIAGCRELARRGLELGYLRQCECAPGRALLFREPDRHGLRDAASPPMCRSWILRRAAGSEAAAPRANGASTATSPSARRSARHRPHAFAQGQRAGGDRAGNPRLSLHGLGRRAARIFAARLTAPSALRHCRLRRSSARGPHAPASSPIMA